MQFMHIADIHLGYQQYGLSARFDDFSRAFLHLIDEACSRRADFVLIAGDLFEKRTVEPKSMSVAIEGLTRLQAAGIPALAVTGNHERAHYREQDSWMDFLDGMGYLQLLSVPIEEGRAVLTPYGEEGSAYVDLPGGVRVYGLKYYGASTGRVLAALAEALPAVDSSGVRYTILMAHTGLEGQLPNTHGAAPADFALLRGRVDYVALGHFHNPYALDDWIFNPGSPETCSMDETAWPQRGGYWVEVEPGAGRPPQVEFVVPPRRPFHRFALRVDDLATPADLYAAVDALIQQKSGQVRADLQPVVELSFFGVLPFSRYELDLSRIQGKLAAAWNPLGVPHVVNQTLPAGMEAVVDVTSGRPELERTVVRGLLGRDHRLRKELDGWTEGLLELKRLALAKQSSDRIVEFLQQLRQDLQGAGEEA